MKKLVIGILLMASGAAQAQVLCSEVLADRGLKLSTQGFEVQRQDDPNSVKEMTVKLLQMTAATLGESFSQKMTKEKGELLLGEALGDGYSLQYEYFVDRRGFSEVFRLGKVMIIKPNGESVILDKKPTTDAGVEFAKPRITPEELIALGLGETSAVANLKKVSAPTVIQGALLKSFLEWAPRMSYLNRTDVQGEGLNSFSLRLKSTFRSNRDFVGGIVKKQSFKLLVFGVLSYLYYSEREGVQDFLASLQDPWGKIISHTNTADIKALLPALDLPLPISKVPTASIELTAALRQINTLANFEKNRSGKPRLFTLSNQKLKELSVKKIVKSVQEVAEDSDQAVVIMLPATKRILILKGDDVEANRVQILGIDGEIQTTAYEQMKILGKVD